MKSLKFYLFVFLILFILTDLSYSQVDVRVTYSAILEGEDYRELESVLLFNSLKNSVFYVIDNESTDRSKFNSQSVKKNDSTPEMNVGFNFQPPEDSLKYFVHINRSLEQIKSKRTIFKDGKYQACIVLEPLDIFEWTLINESKIIDKYTAYKAETTFRGRSYTAWYTPEINLNAGPWKFNGLPGLILEVVDTEKGVQFYLLSIDIPFETNSLLLPPSEKLILTFDEYVDINDPERIANEFLGLISSKLPEGTKIFAPPSISIKKNVKGIERMF